MVPAGREDKNKREKQSVILHGQTVMRLKEIQFEVPVIPIPEQVLKPRVEVKLLLPIQHSISAHQQQGPRQMPATSPVRPFIPGIKKASCMENPKAHFPKM